MLLLCSVSFAFLDVCRKKLATEYTPYRILTILMGAQIPLYALWHFFAPGRESDWAAYLPWGLGSLVLNLAANLLIVKSLQISPLSNAIPLLTLSPTFSLLFQPFFDIPMRPVQILGGAVIFAGACILNGIPRFQSQVDKGLKLMTIASVGCGLLIIFDNHSLHHASIPIHGLVQTVGMTSLYLILAGVYKPPPHEREMKLRNPFLAFWIGGSLSAFTAGIGQLTALQFYDPAIVEAVKRASVLLISVSFGFLFFREPLTQRKILGVFFMSLGIMLSSRI